MKNYDKIHPRNYVFALLIFLALFLAGKLTAQAQVQTKRVEVKDAPEFVQVRLDDSGAYVYYRLEQPAMLSLNRKDGSTLQVRLEPGCSPMHIHKGKLPRFMWYKVVSDNEILKTGR